MTRTWQLILAGVVIGYAAASYARLEQLGPGWARTSRGGKQVELFAPPVEGCMRWGLCDTAPEEP